MNDTQLRSRSKTTKKSKNDRPLSPSIHVKQPTPKTKNRPMFVMGNDDEHPLSEITHTTGRFRVTTKSSPSHSTASQETTALINDKNDKE